MNSPYKENFVLLLTEDSLPPFFLLHSVVSILLESFPKSTNQLINYYVFSPFAILASFLASCFFPPSFVIQWTTWKVYDMQSFLSTKNYSQNNTILSIFFAGFSQQNMSQHNLKESIPFFPKCLSSLQSSVGSCLISICGDCGWSIDFPNSSETSFWWQLREPRKLSFLFPDQH